MNQTPPTPAPPLDRCFYFRGEEILVIDEDPPRFPTQEPDGLPRLREGTCTLHGMGRCAWVELPPETIAPQGTRFASRRELIASLSEVEFLAQGRAYHLLDWTRKNQFCGRCATPTQESEHELARVCPSCGDILYPVIAPAVIVAVERDGKILLGHNGRFPAGRYSVIAGFVEPGETLRETVKREVYEETGVRVTDITYFGSQPWPFPNSLMIGFTAQWEEGEITVDGEEITEAAWFAPHELPQVPPPYSISGRLIRDFVARHGHPSRAPHQ